VNGQRRAAHRAGGQQPDVHQRRPDLVEVRQRVGRLARRQRLPDPVEGTLEHRHQVDIGALALVVPAARPAGPAVALAGCGEQCHGGADQREQGGDEW
jgi:hypothetical protein